MTNFFESLRESVRGIGGGKQPDRYIMQHRETVVYLSNTVAVSRARKGRAAQKVVQDVDRLGCALMSFERVILWVALRGEAFPTFVFSRKPLTDTARCRSKPSVRKQASVLRVNDGRIGREPNKRSSRNVYHTSRAPFAPATTLWCEVSTGESCRLDP